MRKKWQEWVSGRGEGGGQERWGNVFLAPFFALLLWGSWVVDGVSFAMYVVNWRLGRGREWLVAVVGKWGRVGERRQKTLNSAIKWSLTAFLMVLVVWVAGEEVKRALVARERAEQERQWAASWEATKQEYLWPWPESDLAASSAAKQKVQWEIAANLARQADGITGMEERRWSQVDKINIALANYYLGNWTGYQKWLEAAKAMDPNEPMLQIN